MYNAVKTNSIREAKARELAGDDAVDAVLAKNCDFTGRVIDECFGVSEMSASVEFTDHAGVTAKLVVMYLVDSESLVDCDDLGNLDYSNYSFEII
jgi:hypothetical protein